MKVIGKDRIDSADISLDNELVVKSIVRQLVSVHGGSRGLDRPLESVVIVTLLVSQILNVWLWQLSSVHNNFIVDRQSSGSSGVVVSHHIEIEDTIIDGTNNLIVNNCSWSRVDHIAIYFLKESGCFFLVHEDEE